MILCVLTARPSYARIQTALEALRDTGADLAVLCVGAACSPRYGQVSQQVRADGFTVLEVPGAWDDNHPGGMVQMTGHLALTLGQELRRLQPQAVITVADRYETLATAMAASYQGLPLIHVQGGEVSGNIDDKVRRANSSLADLHLVATALSGQRVRQMGVRGPVHVTGCPSIDLALRTTDGDVALPGIGPDVDTRQPFVLVLHHPDTEAWQGAAAQTHAVLEAVTGAGLPAIWFWPNVDAGAAGVEKVLRLAHEGGAPIRFVRQVAPADFVRLMRRCAVMVGNSSALIREGSALGTPGLLVGQRQRGREMGRNVMRTAQTGLVMAEDVQWVRQQPRCAGEPLYGDGQAGPRMAEVMQAWLRRHAAY